MLLLLASFADGWLAIIDVYGVFLDLSYVVALLSLSVRMLYLFSAFDISVANWV
jgi:hypothetical protein